MQSGAFDDDAYLSMLNEEAADEYRSRPLQDVRGNSQRRPNFDTIDESQRKSYRVKFSDQVRGGQQEHYQPYDNAGPYQNNFQASPERQSNYRGEYQDSGSSRMDTFERRSVQYSEPMMTSP